MNKLRGDLMMVLGVLPQIGDEDFKVLSVLMMGTIIRWVCSFLDARHQV